MGVVVLLVSLIVMTVLLIVLDLADLAERWQLRRYARLEAEALQKVLDLEARRDAAKTELRQVTRRTVRQLRRYLREW